MTAPQAERAAFRLCKEMGQFFENEEQRGSTFDKITSSLFQWFPQVVIKPENEQHSGRADACVYGGEPLRMLFIREDKHDGGNGDAYLQACRDYQLYASELLGKQSPHMNIGLPIFLLTLVGKHRPFIPLEYTLLTSHRLRSHSVHLWRLLGRRTYDCRTARSTIRHASGRNGMPSTRSYTSPVLAQ